MMLIRFSTLYVSNQCFRVELSCAAGSRIVCVMLPGEQYIGQFKSLLAQRGFSATFLEEM